ncbi:loricrin, partial [Triticum aestivum]|uniref:loricrin n=1 Tax=Triticum aestivum TaxID=4565 RepID=UPI001D007490
PPPPTFLPSPRRRWETPPGKARAAAGGGGPPSLALRGHRLVQRVGPGRRALPAVCGRRGGGPGTFLRSGGCCGCTGSAAAGAGGVASCIQAALGAGSREVRSSAAGGVPSGFAAVLVGVPVLRRLGAGGACMVTGLGWARLDLAPAGTSRATLLVGSAWCCCDGGRRWSGASGSGVKEGCGQGVGRCGGGLAWMRNGLVLDGSAARGGDAPELGGRRWR